MSWTTRTLLGVCLLGSVLETSLVQAGVVVGGTRLVYDASKRQASLSLVNTDDGTDYLVQSWLDHREAADERPVPFFITPPLFRLDAKQESVLRVVYTGDEAPTDRESLYWLSVKSIAAVERSVENRLQIAIRSRLKMFYRPAGLPGTAEDAHKGVTFTRRGEQLIVTNPSAYFVSFQTVKIGETEITEPGMVAPMDSHQWTVPQGARGPVTWQAINDYGAISGPFSQQ